jgi:uncharacterized membrane protein YkoI
MRSKRRTLDKRATSGVMSLFGIIATVACLGLSGAGALAGDVKDKDQKKPEAVEPTAKLTQEAAAAIALKKVPGTVTAVDIEKKLGRDVYAVEIIAADGGKETDVFIDLKTGDVIGTE